MRPALHAVLLTVALLVSPSFAQLAVHDTLIAGVPWISISQAKPTKPVKGSKPDASSIRFDSDRGVPRATVRPAKGPALSFWDRNPFAKQGKGTISLVLPARVRGKTLLVPRESPVARLLAKSTTPVGGKSPNPPAIASAIPLQTTTTEPGTPTAEPVSRPSEPDPSGMPDVTLPDPVAGTSQVHVPEEPTAPSPGAAKGPSATESDILGDDGVFTVVLDPGHGGKDPGAVGHKVAGKQILEKDATLGIALKIRDHLKRHKGIRVVMTRDTDVFLTLSERTRKANDAKGDLFVSIHCNSLPLDSKRRDEVEGFMVYLLREAKSEADKAIERRENEAIRFETGERQRKEALSPVEWMMLEHQLNQFTKESERFAELAVRNLTSKGPVRKERTGAGQAGFFVLVGALMPSVLVETGYVSHPDDAKSLGSEAGRNAIAAQLARSIDEFRRGKH